MDTSTPAARRNRALLRHEDRRVADVLDRYGASNLRVFGSVARGDAREDSDLDLLVDLRSDFGNDLLRVAGLSEELSEVLGMKVDVVASSLLRDEVSATALADAVPV